LGFSVSESFREPKAFAAMTFSNSARSSAPMVCLGTSPSVPALLISTSIGRPFRRAASAAIEAGSATSSVSMDTSLCFAASACSSVALAGSRAVPMTVHPASAY
jgi:hypothetical protein